MKGIIWLSWAALLVATSVGCKKDEKEASAVDDTPVAATPVAEPDKTETPAPAASAAASPDAPMTAPVIANLDDMTWRDAPPGLPRGAKVALLEGKPPIEAGETFTVVVKIPNNTLLPPHSHLVTERTTALAGSFHLGNGASVKRDDGATKHIKAGGVLTAPANHVHYAYTGDDGAIITIQGVGPWSIHYANPDDDPRKARRPAKPEPLENPYDSKVEPRAFDLAEVEFAPAPETMTMLPAGAQIAVLEGTLPFAEQKAGRVLVKVPDGYELPLHSHGVTVRITVLAGTLMTGIGEAQDEQERVAMHAGAVGVVPAGTAHGARAKGETVLSLMFVGPLATTLSDEGDSHAAAAPADR